MTFSLCFERRFTMAHRLLSGQSDKCSIPHGHNEFIRVKLQALNEAPLSHNINMVTVFQSAKGAWHQFIDNHLDHCLQLRSDDPLIDYFASNEPHLLKRIVITPGDPTTEMLCACLMAKLQAILVKKNEKLNCVSLEIIETPTNSVVLEGVDAYKKHLPSGDYWFYRADNTINDF